jgi:hypothetical protein
MVIAPRKGKGIVMKVRMKNLDPRVEAAVKIDENDLQSEFQGYTGTLAYWLVNRADAQTRVLQAKTRKELAEANARMRILDEEPKLRVDDLNAKLLLEPTVQAAHEELVEAEHNSAYIGAVCEALRRKGDMLVSLGAHQRALLPKGNEF